MMIASVKMRVRAVCLLSLVAVVFIAAGCVVVEPIKMRVLFAGSLIVPFADLETAYERSHPGVDVEMEGHGSIQVVRHITDLHQQADLVVSADHLLIPALMYQTADPDTGVPYADWYMEFATNRLTLGYTDQSLYADEINADNWHEIIGRPGVRLGVPDPRFDAAGYRGLMLVQLAESYYGDGQLFERTLGDRFQVPIRSRYEGDRWVIHVPEIVAPKKDSGLILRGGSIQLIALLESGDVDYAFEYESVSRQHGFRFVPLPDELNMGVAECGDSYGQVEVKLDFQRFASVQPVFRGETIGYGFTIPSNAPHPEQAADLAAFLLGPEGREIMDANYHPLLPQPQSDGQERLPDALRAAATP